MTYRPFEHKQELAFSKHLAPDSESLNIPILKYNREFTKDSSNITECMISSEEEKSSEQTQLFSSIPTNNDV